ncbi:MAG: hypothetical protein ACK5RK_08225, partial [Betaproteobacteria bacterium]
MNRAAALSIALSCVVGVAAAGELEREFPPGKLQTREQAGRAVAAADAAADAAEATWAAEQQRCQSVFFVAACVESARRAYTEA